MKQLFFFVIILLFCFESSLAQQISINYIYDDAGNRTDGICYKELRSIDSTLSTIISDVELLNNFGIRIYPNPTHDKVFIEKSADLDSNTQLYLTKSDGKLVFLNNYNHGKIEISFNQEPAGLYFLSLFIGNKYYRFKIIKN